MTTYQVIAEDARTVSKKLYTQHGTFIQRHSVTLPAKRVVGTWPIEHLAERQAAKMRKRFRQRFIVRPKL